MPTRKEFEVHCAFYEEAIALYEAAKIDFENVMASIRSRIRAGRPPTLSDTVAEEEVRAEFLAAITRLDVRKATAFGDQPPDTPPTGQT